jgi:UDP-2-acetamido-2,6-beta-L-arabino-hexul-4-ose reductase
MAQDHDYSTITIPPGYIHNIVNQGEKDLLVWMWSSLEYDPENDDTYFEKVEV